jgi:hypothetical protein
METIWEMRCTFLGDLIDRRSSKVLRVVEFVRSEPVSHRVMGESHEQEILLESFPNGQASGPALQAWPIRRRGRHSSLATETVESLVEHLDWIRTLPGYLDWVICGWFMRDW